MAGDGVIRAALIVLAFVAWAAFWLGGYAPHDDTHTVTRVPVACTRAALLAEQNQLDWQNTFQAHIDVEQEALDGETYHLYRRHLAEIPGPPQAVDLGVCGR